jgi:hypothetical protein
VHTIFGDFEFQVLDLPSLEDAILAHFAERYPHLIVEEEESDKPGSAPYAQAGGSLTRYWATASILSEARKTCVGFVNADSSARTRKIVSAALGALRDSNTKGISEEAGIASEILSKIYQTGEVLESWKKFAETMHITREHAATLKLVEKVIDSKGIKGFFRKGKWLDTAVGAIQDVEAKKPNLLGRYLLLRKENADPELLKKLTKNAISPKAYSFEASALARVEAKALWALDTAFTVKQMVETITAIADLRTDASGHAARLRRHMDEYGKHFAAAPCTATVRRLEVLRKASDEATDSLDEKTFEAVEQAAKLTLKALTLVPVVGEFAAVTNLAIETLEAMGSIIDATSDVVDRMMFRHRSEVKRFSELAKLHSLQCRAIEAAGAGKHDDPHTQFRLRLVVLIGLLRLIERCGCRQKNPPAFDKKVEQYNIDGYLENYLFSHKPFPIALASGTPLDEVWLYGCGNKETGWNDVAATLGSVSNIFGELIHGTRTIFAPVDFQKFFPIHGKGSKTAKDLARAFSLNFAGVIDKNLEFSCVYVRKSKKDRWVAADDAKFTIEPGTAIRVVAVFKSQSDLTGVPMSLQIKRTDPLVSIDGPVYKTSLNRAYKALSDDLDDKGLLPYTPENQYIGDPTAYACVFFPFYFFKEHHIQGIKPFGHIGLSGDITLDFAFEIKAGDDGRLAKTGTKSDSVRMHLATSNKLHTEMILNKSFLDHKAAEPSHGNLFKHSYQEYQVGSVHWRGADGRWRYAGDKDRKHFKLVLKDKEETEPARQQAAAEDKPPVPWFEWGKRFELLVVFGSLYADRPSWPADPIRVPAHMVVKEKVEGPAFPVDVFSLYRDETFTTVTSDMIYQGLRTNKLIKEGDESYWPAGFVLKQPMALWAARIVFKFQVEGTDGQMISKDGLRPFGERYFGRFGDYTYHFHLRSSDVIGLKLENVLELTVPQPPSDLLVNTALDGDTGWITDEHRRKSLSVEKIK